MKRHPALRPEVVFALVILALAAVAPSVFAGTGGPSLNILQPLTTFLDWLTGPIARAVGGIAMVGAGFRWWTQREDNEAAKFTVRVIVGLGFILGAPTVIQALGFTGAVC